MRQAGFFHSGPLMKSSRKPLFGSQYLYEHFSNSELWTSETGSLLVRKDVGIIMRNEAMTSIGSQ